jgi:hypothetical protein
VIPILGKPLFLLLIPLGAVFIWRLFRQKGSVGFSALSLFSAKALPLGMASRLLLFAVVVFISIALSEPVEHVKSSVPVYKDARDIVLILDTSSSMNQSKKMGTAKEVIGDFVSGLPQYRIGLYSFTTEPYLEWPLSFDHDALLDRLSDLKPAGGTKIATGFIAGLEHLANYGQGKGAVIIVSDGISSVSPKEASAISTLVGETGVKVYWVWISGLSGIKVSSNELALDFRGLIEFLRGTVYQGGVEDLEAIFAEISRLETSPVVYERGVSVIYKFGPILTLVVLSLGVLILTEFVREV